VGCVGKRKCAKDYCVLYLAIEREGGGVGAASLTLHITHMHASVMSSYTAVAESS
jgi:hypothetical protein